MADKFAIGVLVANRPGVLTRISALFSRRGFNIDSLTVGETDNPDYSRMTIGARGDDYVKDQIVKQLYKLYDIKSVTIMDSLKTVFRELLLIKIRCSAGKRSEIIEAANIYRASVVDLAAESLTIELTGETAKINAFVDYMRTYGIIEMCRTGITAVERGANILSVESNDPPVEN